MQAPRTAIAALTLSAATLVGMALHEGYKGEAYYATEAEKVAGINTLGFGTTESVKPGDRITPERALVRLLADASKFENAVKRCAPVPMHNYEFNSMVSLTYNIGEGAFCRSTIAKHLNSGNYAGACEGILAWDKQAGKPLRGLTIRRQAEHQLCLGPQA